MEKLSKLIGIVVAVLGIICLFLVFFTSSEAFTDTENTGYATAQAVVSGFITLAMATLAIAAGFILFLSVKQIAGDPQQLKGILIGLGLLAAVFVVSYVLSGSDPISIRQDGVDKIYEGSIVKLVGTAIYSTMILLGGATFAWIGSEVSKTFK